MLFNFAPTPYDVNFRLFGFHVRVHPLFWLMSLLYGYSSEGELSGPMNAALTGITVACVFVSILVHELGHAFLIRYEGFVPEIVLHGFGGFAAYMPYRAIRPGMKMTISFAGPAAGFIFYGLLCALEELLQTYARGQVHYLVWIAIYILKDINLWWGLFNLLPIYPLDGGQIARVFMESRWRLAGLAYSLFLSIVLCAGMILWSYQRSHGNLLSMPVVLFAMLCYENIQEYQQLGYRGR
jgi:stage IV sporulation protein FB